MSDRNSAKATEQTAADLKRSTIAHGNEGNDAVRGPLHASAGQDSAIGFPRRGMFGVSGPGDTSGYGELAREPWIPPSAEPPYGGYFDELLTALAAAYPGFGLAVTRVVVDRNELTLHVAREHLLGVATALRNDPDLRFELCSSVSGVDYYNPRDEGSNRLHSVCHLASMTYRRRIRLEVAVSVADPHIPSLTALYPTADWQEREAYDMFGIIYDGHPALTRILMPDDWDGYPQRKDSPLGGISVQYKGANIPPPDERRVYQ